MVAAGLIIDQRLPKRLSLYWDLSWRFVRF